MAKPRKPTAPLKRTVTLPYRPSDQFVSVLADGNVISARADEAGALINMLFTRLETHFKSETHPTETVDDITKIVGPVTFQMEDVRTMLFSVAMRPDHALGLVGSIVTQLMQLPQIIRDKYNIPDFELMMPPEKPQ